MGTNCDIVESNASEWTVDWELHRIIIHNSDPLMTYRIIVYANMIQLNERFGAMQDKQKKDMAGL